MSRRSLTAFGSLLVAALSCGSCGSPTAPAATAPITAVQYQHVTDVTIESDTRVELEFWDCRKAGLVPGLAGPDVCLLTRDTGNIYRCTASGFMKDASTTCDSSITVRLRTASRNPFFATGHDIYVNGMKVTRVRADSSLDYPQEVGIFTIDAAGRIH